MPARFVDVIIEAHPELPDGCAVRFQALGEATPVTAVRYQPGVGAPGPFDVQGRAAGGAPAPATATPVHVTGAAPRVLIAGGAWGLRLRRRGAPGAPGAPTPTSSVSH
jgi:hypothetical protein